MRVVGCQWTELELRIWPWVEREDEVLAWQGVNRGAVSSREIRCPDVEDAQDLNVNSFASRNCDPKPRMNLIPLLKGPGFPEEQQQWQQWWLSLLSCVLVPDCLRRATSRFLRGAWAWGAGAGGPGT